MYEHTLHCGRKHFYGYYLQAIGCMTQEMCDNVVSKELFALKYCPDRYETQEMCDRVVDTCLLALKFVCDWFVMNKKIEKLDNAVFFNDGIVFDYIDSDIVTFFSNDIGLNIINLNIINLDDVNLKIKIPKLLIMLDLWLRIIDLNNIKDIKKK